jgi:hypothetical protein
VPATIFNPTAITRQSVCWRLKKHPNLIAANFVSLWPARGSRSPIRMSQWTTCSRRELVETGGVRAQFLAATLPVALQLRCLLCYLTLLPRDFGKGSFRIIVFRLVAIIRAGSLHRDGPRLELRSWPDEE